MGMFDSVYIECPYCGDKTEVQSKSGDCTLDTYNQYNVPIAVAFGLINRADTCDNCNKIILVIENSKRIPENVELIAVKHTNSFGEDENK